MDVKKWLFSNMFFRNIITDLFGYSDYDRTRGTFVPYFQYKIGPYQGDYYLYFPVEPYLRQYKNELFNKLHRIHETEIINYLEFHYLAYHDKQAFQKFFRDEIRLRLKQKMGGKRRRRLQFSQDWIAEKQQELHSADRETLKQEIEHGVLQMLPSGRQVSPKEVEDFAKALSEKLSGHIDQIMAAMAERMLSLTDSFVTANIELNNQNHIDKLIKLFKLLKDVQAPKEFARGEQLFKRFSDADIAAILRLHFKGFNKQLNSIQKTDIKKAYESIPDKNPKLKKLEESLSDYFYG